MIKKLRVAVDHGNRNMKTCNHVFTTGLTEMDKKPARGEIYLQYQDTARHPSAIGVAVNVGCWSHRRGHIIFDKDLNYTITTHSGVEL